MIRLDQSKQKFWFLLAIVSVTFIVFSPALQNQFTNWDDGVFLVENSEVHEFSPQAFKTMFSKNYVGTYTPLTILSFNIEYSLLGNQPPFYYLDNLLLHLAVVALVFLLAQKFGLSVIASGFAALIFGIHPMHVESVAWISQRKDVLYSFFYLMAMVEYWNYLLQNKKTSYWRALLFAFFSILAKPMAYSLPVILLLCDWWHKRKIDLKVVAEKIPFIFLIGGVSFVTYISNPQEVILTSWKCVLVWIWVFVFHIHRFLFPSQFFAVYQVPEPISLGSSDYLFSVVAFVGLVTMLLLFRRQRWIWLAVVFYFLSNSMIIFRAVWEFGNNTLVADRFMYLPSFGFCMAGGVLYHAVYTRLKKLHRLFVLLFLSSTVFLFVVLGMRTIDQVKVWKNNTTLWSHVIQYNPKQIIAFQNRASGYVQDERYDLAMHDLNYAIRLSPHQARLYYSRADLFEKQKDFQRALHDLDRSALLNSADANIYFLRGKIYQSLGQGKNALREYDAAIARQKDFDRAFYNRGILFDEMGRADLALADYAQVIRINPRHAKVYNNSAYIYIGRGEYEKALYDLLKAVKIDPKNVQAYGNLGILAFLQQDYQKAFNYFQTAIMLDPNFSAAYLNRGVIYAVNKKNELALADINRAIVLDSKNTDAYFTRALFNYNLGKMDLAKEDLQKALAVDPNNLKAQNLKSQLVY